MRCHALQGQVACEHEEAYNFFYALAWLPERDRPARCFIFISLELEMARVCQVTGKAPMVGHHVSHANNKTKRRFMPNLQYRRFWVESENRWVRLRLTTAGLRTVDKIGIDAVLADLRARGEI